MSVRKCCVANIMVGDKAYDSWEDYKAGKESTTAYYDSFDDYMGRNSSVVVHNSEQAEKTREDADEIREKAEKAREEVEARVEAEKENKRIANEQQSQREVDRENAQKKLADKIATMQDLYFEQAFYDAPYGGLDLLNGASFRNMTVRVGISGLSMHNGKFMRSKSITLSTQAGDIVDVVIDPCTDGKQNGFIIKAHVFRPRS